MYTPNGTDAQRWLAEKNADGSVTFHSKTDPALCVDVTGASREPGTPLQLYRKNGTVAQRFYIGHAQAINESKNPYILAPANDPGQALDVAGAGTADGTNVQLYEQNGTAAQLVDITFDYSTGTYKITSLASGKPLDVDGAKSHDGANVQVYHNNDTLAQRWSFEQLDYNRFRIYASCSGLALDAAGAGTANGTNVQT
jgi:hypothetical protein